MDEQAVRRAVGPVLVNAMNFPAKVTPHILGQDMEPLIDKVVQAVLAQEDSGQPSDGYAYDLGSDWVEATGSEFLAASSRGEEIAETRRGKPLTLEYEHRYWVRKR